MLMMPALGRQRDRQIPGAWQPALLSYFLASGSSEGLCLRKAKQMTPKDHDPRLVSVLYIYAHTCALIETNLPLHPHKLVHTHTKIMKIYSILIDEVQKDLRIYLCQHIWGGGRKRMRSHVFIFLSCLLITTS